MIKRNFQQELNELIAQLSQEQRKPKLLLHSCCAPCSSYCIEYLSQYFELTIFFYNPNIHPKAEYEKRLSWQNYLLEELPAAKNITLIAGEYIPETFFTKIKGWETEKEGGKRCEVCYSMRLEESAKTAKVGLFDYFSTVLTISPHKNAQTINILGEEIGKKYGIKFLTADFKKNNGYLQSLNLCKTYNLYRQNYCGCTFSQVD
ncbi:hypothetical protein FACS189418_3780 [Clostridia bacterium]|nr:hypothetical protein FACS189418_3780 [Clostridia bacterium]